MCIMKTDDKATKDEFYIYDIIRSSGLTNMFDVETVIKYSIVMDGPVLTKETILEIMKNYDHYLELYPLPDNGVVAIKAPKLKEESDEA